jgi:transposase
VLPYCALKATNYKDNTLEKYIVKLTPEERENLLTLIKTGKASANKLSHARILLMADESNSHETKNTDEAIGKRLHVSAKTVARIRKQFVEEGVESALLRKPHANPRSRKLDGEQEAHLIALCCSSPPEGRSRWTLKLLANKLVEMEIAEEISSTTIGRVLKKMN